MNLQNQEYKLIVKSLNVSVANTDLTLKKDLIPDAKMLILFAKKPTATDKKKACPLFFKFIIFHPNKSSHLQL